MANSLDVELIPLNTAITASGTGESVDIGARSTAKLKLALFATTVGQLTVKVETSSDGTNWTSRAQVGATRSLAQDVALTGLSRYLRASWTLSSGEFVATLAGTALDIYCTPSDVQRLGIPGHALDDVETSLLLDLCVDVTDEADGHVGAAYALPLLKWGGDLRLHCCKMVVRYLLDARGWDPEGVDQVFMEGYNQATKWLRGVAKGEIAPAGIVDSTPTVIDSGSYVTSRPRREAFR
jgi:phage gp36-like protein